MAELALKRVISANPEFHDFRVKVALLNVKFTRFAVLQKRAESRQNGVSPGQRTTNPDKYGQDPAQLLETGQ